MMKTWTRYHLRGAKLIVVILAIGIGFGYLGEWLHDRETHAALRRCLEQP